MGNDDGSLNVLSIKQVKCVQSIKVCSAPVFFIMEMDESTIVVVSKSGEISLVYNEAD